MKKIIFSIIFIGIFLLIAEDAKAQQRGCAQFRDSTEVAVYEHSSYKGKCTNLKTGKYMDTGRLNGLNLRRQISSIIIGKKAQVVLCSDYNFRGVCKTVTRSYNNLRNVNFNDSALSIRVELKPTSATPPRTSRARHSAPSNIYKYCASEGGNCRFSGKAKVAYGVNGKFRYRNNVNGSIACNNRTFGDPVPGVQKRCYYYTPRVVNGRNVGIVNYNGGTFTKGSSGKWFEYKKGKQGIHATFTETGRDEWSVFLRKSDGARIQLDLYRKEVKLNGRVLYRIVSFS